MAAKRPIIGITTYNKRFSDNPIIDICGTMCDYKNAILKSGGIPLMLPLGLDSAAVDQIMDMIDGVLLPGGGDINPTCYIHQNGDRKNDSWPPLRGVDDSRDAMEVDIILKALARDMPMLAVCRGHQMLNVALGGTLWQDLNSQRPSTVVHDNGGQGILRTELPHRVKVEEGSTLAQLLGTTETLVNSIHHQGIKRLADRLVPVAWSDDDLIEGMEIPDRRFMVSVQWHPENLVVDLPHMLGLFQGLVDAAATPTPAAAEPIYG